MNLSAAERGILRTASVAELKRVKNEASREAAAGTSLAAAAAEGQLIQEASAPEGAGPASTGGKPEGPLRRLVQPGFSSCVVAAPRLHSTSIMQQVRISSLPDVQRTQYLLSTTASGLASHGAELGLRGLLSLAAAPGRVHERAPDLQAGRAAPAAGELDEATSGLCVEK